MLRKRMHFFYPGGGFLMMKRPTGLAENARAAVKEGRVIASFAMSRLCRCAKSVPRT
jgi:hypothetical protein